jgi:hypothetical protein
VRPNERRRRRSLQAFSAARDTEAEVELALRRLMWGDELFVKVYPQHAALTP